MPACSFLLLDVSATKFFFMLPARLSHWLPCANSLSWFHSTTLFIPQHFSCYITFPQHFSTTLFIPLSLHLCCVSRTVPWHEAACLFAATTQHNVLLVCNVLLSNACVWLCCSPVGVCLHINCLAMASNQLFTY